VPIDVLAEFGNVDVHAHATTGPIPPKEADIDSAISEIRMSRRIVIYAGGGAVASGASTALEHLATQLGAPVITSTMGKGSVSDHHWTSIGNLWSAGNTVDDMLRSADLAIVVGSKLGAQETDYQTLPLPSRIIRIDIDPDEAQRNYPASVSIVADARLAVEALGEALAGEDDLAPGWSAEDVQAVKRDALARMWGARQFPYVEALRHAIPDDGILVTDMTMMGYVCNNAYPVYAPRTYFHPSGYGTLGYSLPAALGAKVAMPERTVAAVIGDGGFQYTMQEVATAVQFNLGVPIVIFNDSTYTAVKDAQAREHDRRFIGVDLVNPDFLKLADAYGVPGVRAETPDALETAIREASTRDQPTIIDAPIRFVR
jgi:thiamine pyrophosphate-dependent acetolactate synthase large subunit-like protein